MTGPGANVVLQHMHLSWGGNIAAGQEIWSNALNYRVGPEVPSEAELQAIAVACAPVLAAWVSRPASSISSGVFLDWVKAVWVTGSGRQRDVNTALVDLPFQSAQGGDATPRPFIQTYAITLRTALNRGVGHAGRIYPPVSGPPPQTAFTPYAAESVITAMNQSFATCLNELRAAINTSLGGVGRAANAVVVSRVSATNPLPRLTDITRVVMDRVADVQHRRDNQVPRNEVPAIVVAA